MELRSDPLRNAVWIPSFRWRWNSRDLPSHKKREAGSKVGTNSAIDQDMGIEKSRGEENVCSKDMEKAIDM